MKTSSKVFAVIAVLALASIVSLVFIQSKTSFQNDYPKADKEELIASDQPNDGTSVEKAYMYDVSGGDGYGIARRAYASNEFVLSVEAGVPEINVGESYTLSISDDNGDKVNGGELQKSDQGFYLEFQSKDDLRSYNKLQVDYQNGNKELKTILEGKFDGAAQ